MSRFEQKKLMMGWKHHFPVLRKLKNYDRHKCRYMYLFPIVVIERNETCLKPISPNISYGCMFKTKFMMRSTLFKKLLEKYGLQ